MLFQAYKSTSELKGYIIYLQGHFVYLPYNNLYFFYRGLNKSTQTT